jgi:hypothetical protein
MAREIILPIKFRAPQAKLEQDAEKFRYYVAVCHRGFGKTYFAMAWLIKWALRRPKMKFAYIAPELKQAKKVTWSYFKSNLEPVPGIQFNEAELVAKLPNGSSIYLEGAENPDRIRGNHYAGIVLDEVGDMPAGLWELVLFPALQAHRGRALFIGTPKGHNLFYDFYQRAERPEFAKQWGSCLVDIYTSGVFDAERIQDIEMEYLGREALWAQEYLCAFDAETSLEASVYAKVLSAIQHRGQIASIAVDPLKTVFCGIDLGLVDRTCMWFAQIDPKTGNISIIDYYENSNQTLPFYINILKSKDYIYHTIFLPHDAARRSLNTSVSTLEILQQHGFKCVVLPKTQSVSEDIQSVKGMIHRTWFHADTCGDGIKQLRAYGAKMDRISGKATDKLEHNDCADAFRYLMLGLATKQHELTRPQNHDINNVRDYRGPLNRFRELNSKGKIDPKWR